MTTDDRVSVPDEVARAAALAASRACELAGVRIREAASVEDCIAVRSVLDRVWNADPTNPAATVELLRAYSHTGQYVTLAEDVTSPEPFPGNVIAASVGFLGAPIGRALHSNVTGVLPAGLRRSLGFAVKVHQRAWALAHGLELVTWTYDPLIRRNAWFNLAKLGAVPTHYLENFYGSMADAINAGDESDRIYVHWLLASDVVAAACAGTATVVDTAALLADGSAEVLLSVGDDGAPVLISPAAARVARPASPAGLGDPGGRPGQPRVRLVQVPVDIESLRSIDPGQSRAWRSAVREALGGNLSHGWRVRGMGRDGWYVLDAAATEGEP